MAKRKSKSRLSSIKFSESAQAKRSSSKIDVSNKKSSPAAVVANSLSRNNFESIKEWEARKAELLSYCKHRSEFIKFIKTCGIKAAVVRGIVSLYEESTKPDNALGYIACFLGAAIPSDEEIKGQLEKLQQLRYRISSLEDENQNLKDKLERLEMAAMNDLLNEETVGEYDGDAEDEEYNEAETGLFDPELASCIDSNLSFTFNI